MKRNKKRNAKVKEIYDYVIIAIIEFVAVVFYCQKGNLDSTNAIIMAVGVMIIMTIAKAVYIITDIIQDEKDFLSLFLLQEIRKKKVENEKDLTELIYGTVDDLSKFSTVFYKIFND